MKKLMIGVALMLPLILQAQDIKRLKLSDAVAYAKQNAVDLKNAELDVRGSEQEVKSIIASGLPQVTANANFTHNVTIASVQLPDFISPSVYGVLINEGLLSPDRFKAGSPQTVQFGAPSSLTGSVSLNQLVFDGTYFLGLKAARDYVELRELIKDLSEVQLVENVHKSFYAALITNYNIGLAEKSLQQISQTYTETQALYQQGFVEKLDVDRMLLQKTSMENRLNNLSMQRDIMVQMLKITIGMPLNQAIELEGSMEDYLVQNLGSLDAGVSHRAEYKILQQQVLLDSLNIKRYKVGYYPSLNLNAMYQQNSFATEAEFKNLGKTWNPGTFYGFNLNIPIFDGFYKQSKISQARLQMEKDRNTLQQTENQLLFQAEQARLNLRVQTSNFETQQKMKELAQSIYQTTLIKFNEGVASSFELVQAENDRVAAEMEYSSALYQLLLAQIELNRTLGTLNK